MPGYFIESSCEISKCTWAGLNHTDKGQNYTFFPHFNDLSFPPLTTTKVDVALKGSLMHFFFYFYFSMRYNIKCTKLKCTALLILESVCLCHLHPDQNVK